VFRCAYRLSISAHSDRFILKGALLFVTWLPDPFRPTRDLDLLGYGANSSDARIPIQIDIGFGDVITPEPVEIDYPALLDSQPRIFAPIRSKLSSRRSSTRW